MKAAFNSSIDVEVLIAIRRFAKVHDMNQSQAAEFLIKAGLAANEDKILVNGQ